MRLNINKIIYIILCSLGLALGIFTSAISLLTTNFSYNCILLLLTYYLAFRIANAIYKYPLFIKR